MLEIKNISKTYNGRKVVDNVDFAFECGSVVGILGPNGSGKTTCFYMITGIINPDSGSVILNGSDITNLPIHIRAKIGIGYLPQEASIFRGLTVEENILLVLELYINKKSDRIKRLDGLLKEFGILHLRNNQSSTLSGGERRRLEIARLLAIDPQYILLDEPFAGVDPIAVLDIRNVINRVKSKGVGVIITDHNVRETLKIIDYGYIMYDGRILCSGTRDNIVNDQRVREIYLGNEFTHI